MNVARLLFALMSLLSLSAVAELEFPSADDFCPMSPSHQILSCQGTFHAHTEADLDEYLQTVGLRNGYARNLRLHFDVNRPSLFLATPCRVVLEVERSITTTDGELCLNAHRVVFNLSRHGHSHSIARDQLRNRHQNWRPSGSQR